MNRFLILSLCITAVASKTCPVFSPVTGFNLTAYMGKWYEVARYPAPFEIGATCVFAEYTLEENKEGKYVKVNNTALKKGEYESSIGVATQPENGVGAFLVTFSKFMPTPKTPNYNILSLEYGKYALVYSCTQVFDVPHVASYRIEFAWILSRENTLEEEKIEEMIDILKSLGSNYEQMIRTEQKNC